MIVLLGSCGGSLGAGPKESVTPASSDSEREADDAREAALGAEAALEIEATYGVVEDAVKSAKLARMVGSIVPHTGRPGVRYRVKILDDQDVNALSLPGGYLYVTQGLLEFAESDHELAGVLAHEIAHNVHRHSLHLIEQNEKLERKMLYGVALAVLLGQAGIDPTGLLFMGSALRVREMSSYTRPAEAEADASAVTYLRATDYHPVGLLTFMERLHRLEKRRPHLELGIFQTHPATEQRIRSLIAQLEAAGIPLDRRAVTDVARAEVRPVTVRGRDLLEVVVRGRTVFQPTASRGCRSASSEEERTPAERCRLAAERINAQFDAGVQARQIQVVSDGNDWLVTARGQELLRLGPSDGAFHQQSAEQLARQAAAALRLALWEDFVKSTG